MANGPDSGTKLKMDMANITEQALGSGTKQRILAVSKRANPANPANPVMVIIGGMANGMIREVIMSLVIDSSAAAYYFANADKRILLHCMVNYI